LRAQLRLRHSPGFAQGAQVRGQLRGRVERQLFHAMHYMPSKASRQFMPFEY
jgi:hypothetical protein